MFEETPGWICVTEQKSNQKIEADQKVQGRENSKNKMVVFEWIERKVG